MLRKFIWGKCDLCDAICMHIEGEINVRNNSERELSSKMEGEKESNSKIKL